MAILINLIDLVFQIYMVLLVVRILASWIPELYQYRFMHFVAFYTDPYLNLFRRIIPPLGMMDFSPIIAFLCLGFIERILIRLIVMLFV